MSTQVRKPRILVIDDSEAIHQDFRKLLCADKTLGVGDLLEIEARLFNVEPARELSPEPEFEVESAYQGKEGVTMVQEAQAAGHPYALVFLDYRMPPGWNGIETLRHLRKVAPSVPVVLCSAHSDYFWKEISKEFGRSALLKELRKPFHIEEMLRLAHDLTSPPLV